KGFFSSARGVGIKEHSECLDKSDELLELYDTKNWQEFIRQAIVSKKNIIISGGTSSGKTTFLNSCVGQIPLHERLITLEDTYEMDVPHTNIVRLKALKQVGEQTQKITMQDLVQATLRLRPDRIIMGEIRGRELFDFVSACSTGHSGALATIHANNPKVAFMRMAQLYKLNQVAGMDEADIYKVLHEVIDVIVQLQKTPDGRRLVEVYYK
ncbi:TPA: P-type DNA transfer ATPase VirB11, partial [Legionella pneumophila]|nr:P-type DNA transfer ATPase VirB11 [Legionella pneumophila]